MLTSYCTTLDAVKGTLNFKSKRVKIYCLSVFCPKFNTKNYELYTDEKKKKYISLIAFLVKWVWIIVPQYIVIDEQRTLRRSGSVFGFLKLCAQSSAVARYSLPVFFFLMPRKEEFLRYIYKLNFSLVTRWLLKALFSVCPRGNSKVKLRSSSRYKEKKMEKKKKNESKGREEIIKVS